MADLSKLVDELSSLTVLEAAELAKMLEEKWGVSAAAAVAVAAGSGRWRCCRSGRGADRVHGHARRRWRQEDRGHQGSPRDHRPRPQGSQGPRRRRAEGRQGSRHQGRGREAQGTSSRRPAPRSSSSKTPRAASGARSSREQAASRPRTQSPGRSYLGGLRVVRAPVDPVTASRWQFSFGSDVRSGRDTALAPVWQRSRRGARSAVVR